MKLESKQFAARAPQLTRPNQAWMVDFMMLDLAERPLVRLVVDVGTRRPLSATLTLGHDDDFAAGLDRLVRRTGRPDQIWFENRFEFCLGAQFRFWAHEHRISIIYCPTQTPTLKSIAEPLLRSLRAYLHDKHLPKLMEVGHEIERWRQSYPANLKPLTEATE